MENIMSRKEDVETILTAAKKQHQEIRDSYKKSLSDESLDLRVPVKNLMENLRSALDYMAHDIYESCCKAERVATGKPDPHRIYFPYGLTEADFNSEVGKSLPGLATLSPTVYDLLVSIQPFRSGDSWLYDLCSILNKQKHDRLTRQTRSETETYTVSNGTGSVTDRINDPSVHIRSLQGAVKIFGVPAQFTDQSIRTAPSDQLDHERTRWVAFLFEGTGTNVLDLLNTAVPGISDLGKSLYEEL
jgi:hypothetical protein